MRITVLTHFEQIPVGGHRQRTRTQPTVIGGPLGRVAIETRETLVTVRACGVVDAALIEIRGQRETCQRQTQMKQ